MHIEHFRLTVKGRVQGVFFRASTQKKANLLAIKGTARNTAEGDVEIMAIGEPQAMQQFIKWCHKGPLTAKVTEVEVEQITDLTDYTQFSIIK